ncbi:hypothetical protein [Phaeovulum sp.]|uniref:hypothetical protein n=1 Tax=Phaeovulum sp. TaxID=2934796 RepID=UPI0039E63678
MLIFWEQRLVFLATPKAGSTAIEAALESLASVAIQRPEALKHVSAANYQHHLAPLLAASAGGGFTTVALMREPVEWLRSWFRFRQRDDIDDPEHSMRGRSFENFAADYMQMPPPPHASIGSQSAYLCDSDGTALVDRIFRYEEMDTFVTFLEDALDCAITLPRVNVPPAVDVELSEAMRTRLRTHMSPDCRLYDTLG